MDNTGNTTREKLLYAALDLFSSKGFEATTVDEIAGSVGMKGPNIYNYFKGKKGLILDLTAMFEDTYKAKMRLEANPADFIHSAEDLKNFSMEKLRYTVGDDNIRKLRRIVTIEQFRNEYLSEEATTHQYSNIVGLFTGIMASLMKKGVVMQCDPEQLALMYASPVSMLIQLYDREPERRDEILIKAEAHIDLFIKMFCIK